MRKFKHWEEVKKELNFTPQEEIEIKLEMELIKATIETRNVKNRD